MRTDGGRESEESEFLAHLNDVDDDKFIYIELIINQSPTLPNILVRSIHFDYV